MTEWRKVVALMSRQMKITTHTLSRPPPNMTKIVPVAAAMLLLVMTLSSNLCESFSITTTTTISRRTTSLFGKKKGTPGPNYKKTSGQQQKKQEKASIKDAKFDAATRQFMFTLVGLTKTLPDKSKDILKNINLSFYPGAKIGVVGLNGSGKSTLLKIMAGLETEYDGIARPLPGASIGYLSQEPILEYETVKECIDAAVSSSRAILDKYTELGLKMAEPDISDDEMTSVMNEMERIGDKIEAENLWELDRTVQRAMDSLRVPPGDAKTLVLSGGEKRRVSLCQLLLASHDMLLLDEPTNHLDAESISWLEQFLDQFKGTVVCITHDRYFLENVAKWILELDRGQGIPFEGNYSNWLSAKNARLEGEKKSNTAAAKAVSAELEWVRSNPKAKGTKSKARLKRYDELLLAAAPTEMRTEGQIYIPPGPRLGDVVIDMHGVRKAFGERLLIDGLEFNLPKAGIVGVIGPNGAGKSTLINMITGKDVPDAGHIQVGETVSMISVGQDRMDQLDSTKTVYEEICGGRDEIELGGNYVNSRAYVSWFGFKSAQQQQLVG
jgi:ATP-binding cassette ChvD family protein